ncbi:MAG: sigma-70 family RNA polymerase sigma factor [Thermostichus sp. BF3_bins_97]
MPSENGDEEIQLLVKIAQQDQTALSELYDRYARILLGLAYRLVGSLEEAEEVVLDVFNQVWRIAARYDPSRGRVDVWLFMLTRSRALDRLRALQRAAKAIPASQVALSLNSGSPEPEENLQLSERRELIQTALEQIPPEQRQVLELAYFGGLTQSEIARQTGIPLGTIKKRARLGLWKLREILLAKGWSLSP